MHEEKLRVYGMHALVTPGFVFINIISACPLTKMWPDPLNKYTKHTNSPTVCLIVCFV